MKGLKMGENTLSLNLAKEKVIISEKEITYKTVRRYKVDIPVHILDSPERAKHFLEPLFEKSPIENLYAIALNSNNEFLGFIRISQGTVSRAAVYPRELISFLLIESNATAVILAHNHTSHSTHPRPSQEDLLLTKRIMKILEGLEIRLLDHLIYAPGRLGQDGSWVSMSAEGHI